MNEEVENNKKSKIAIIGVASLTGDRLMKILDKHPMVDVDLVTSEYFAGRDYTSKLKYIALNDADFTDTEIIFSCQEHGKSMGYLPNLVTQGKLVIDLAADFRTPAHNFIDWYKKEHLAPDLTPATYGLCEVFKEEIAESKFIASPGCYPTSVLLALAPLLKSSIDLENVNVVSLSGRSGAGRKKAKEYEKDKGNVVKYKSVAHQHIGEMQYCGSLIGDKELNVQAFHPHVLTDVFRGMITTVIAQCRVESEEKLLEIYQEYYEGQPFIKLKKVDNSTQISIKDIVMKDKNDDYITNNNCLIGLHYDADKGVLHATSVIDNLIKGASGQAVQNMNIAMGWDQTLGLGLVKSD